MIPLFTTFFPGAIVCHQHEHPNYLNISFLTPQMRDNPRKERRKRMNDLDCVSPHPCLIEQHYNLMRSYEEHGTVVFRIRCQIVVHNHSLMFYC